MANKGIKTVLVGLGVAGSVAFGAGAATVITSLPTPDIDTPAPKEFVCEGEEITVSRLPICLDKANYGLIKSALKTKFDAKGGVEMNDFALHIGVLDNEIKKDPDFKIENYDSMEGDLFTLLTDIYL